MATRPEFAAYIQECLSCAGDVRMKKMFGEYGVYLDDKFIAVVCDDQLFLKPTEAGRALLKTEVLRPPYKGAKDSFLIEEFEDREYMTALLRATWEALPVPKPRKPRA